MKKRLQKTLRQIISHFSSVGGRDGRSMTERVGFLTDGQSNLLSEKTGIAKTKIK